MVGWFIADNWEYVVAGVMVVAGVALMFTGIGGAAGIAVMAASSGLMNMGTSMITQKLTTGKVNLTQTLTDGLMGAAIGGVNRLKSTLNTTQTILTLTNNTNKITTLTKNSSKATQLGSWMGGGIKTTASDVVAYVKNGLTSKESWIKFGVGTGKGVVFDGTSSIVEAKINGETITVGDVLKEVAWGRATSWIKTGTNQAANYSIGRVATKDGWLDNNREILSEGASESLGGVISFVKDKSELDSSDDDYIAELIQVGANTVIDSAGSWSSSYSSRKINQFANSDNSLSGGEALMLELSTDFVTDMNATVLGWGAKGLYQEHVAPLVDSITASEDTITTDSTVDTPPLEISENEKSENE